MAPALSFMAPSLAKEIPFASVCTIYTDPALQAARVESTPMVYNQVPMVPELNLQSTFNQMPYESAVRQQTQQAIMSAPVNSVRQECISFLKHGDRVGLQTYREQLQHELKSAWFSSKTILQEQIAFINTLLESPITKALAIIKDGSLSEAYATLYQLEAEFYCLEDMPRIEEPNAARLVASKRDALGFNSVEAGRLIFRRRADYHLLPELQKQKEANAKQPENLVTTQVYQLNDQAVALFDQQGLNPKEFQVFSGNELKQAIHQQYVDIVNSAADLHVKYHNNDSVKQFAQTTVTIADIGHQYNKNGFVLEAQHIADFCKALLHHTKEAAIGAYEGIPIGIVRTIEMIQHPIHTITGIAESAVSAAKGYLYIMMEASDLEMRFGLSAEMGEKKAQEIGKLFRPVHESIKQKISELTVRDCSRMAASAVTEGFLQAKLLKATGSFFNLVSKELQIAAREIPAAMLEEQLLVTTADGQVLKMAGGPGKDTMSFRDMVEKGPKNTFGSNTVPQVEKTRNTFKVGNMKEFFKTEFGAKLKKVSTKVKGQNQTTYKLNDKIAHSDLNKGDIYYLDTMHRDHLEVFKKNGEIRMVINLDGTINVKKTAVAIQENRSIKV